MRDTCRGNRAQGVLAPAVDGDFAVLIVFNSTQSRYFLDALAHECDLAGVACEVVIEPAFGGQ
jgi:hypothetical protein